ncbi:hypothetical protein ACLB2K_005532 [Fragaria x ananassa]
MHSTHWLENRNLRHRVPGPARAQIVEGRILYGGRILKRSLDLYGGRILKRDFEPGFYVNHFVKDLGICLKECQNMVCRVWHWLSSLTCPSRLMVKAIWAPNHSLWLWSASTMCHLMNKLVRQSNKTRVDYSNDCFNIGEGFWIVPLMAASMVKAY